MDEAVSLAKTVAAASPHCLVLALCPLLQASTEQAVVVRRRRRLEDLMLARLVCIEHFTLFAVDFQGIRCL